MVDRVHAAVLFLHQSTQRVLLQHRTDDAPRYPGSWGFFGGGGEPEDDGDSLRTARREIREELGLELDPERVVLLWDYLTDEGVHRRVYLYPWEDPAYPFIIHEGQGYGWFTPADALDTLELTPNARRDLEHLATRITAP